MIFNKKMRKLLNYFVLVDEKEKPLKIGRKKSFLIDLICDSKKVC